VCREGATRLRVIQRKARRNDGRTGIHINKSHGFGFFDDESSRAVLVGILVLKQDGLQILLILTSLVFAPKSYRTWYGPCPCCFRKNRKVAI
jgi:hypothetical protein